ncbi:hypothetical protein PG999_007372 [Apiospora kogelbergensis]|uniref:Copper amine oxidase catalytic domain-containing protein n=1 Tax=Apiospora kogelbergensis TaxID=1337665 RepID=A0AAW0QY88_9PEZI
MTVPYADPWQPFHRKHASQRYLPLRIDARTNPNGNAYAVVDMPIPTSTNLNASPATDRVFKVQNLTVRNPVSDGPVDYKTLPPVTQLLLADPQSTRARRHLWVTRHRDNEFYAGGRYTLQSLNEEEGGAERRRPAEGHFRLERFWSHAQPASGGLADYILEPHIKPVDFFTANPSLDVTSDRDFASQYASKSSNAQESSPCCESQKPLGGGAPKL